MSDRFRFVEVLCLDPVKVGLAGVAVVSGFASGTFELVVGVVSFALFELEVSLSTLGVTGGSLWTTPSGGHNLMERPLLA